MKPQDTPAQKDIDVFFATVIPKPLFASYLRQFAHASIMLNFEVEDSSYQNKIKEGYYWLTEFAELIDPYLEKNNLKPKP